MPDEGLGVPHADTMALSRARVQTVTCSHRTSPCRWQTALLWKPYKVIAIMHGQHAPATVCIALTHRHGSQAARFGHHTLAHNMPGTEHGRVIHSEGQGERLTRKD